MLGRFQYVSVSWISIIMGDIVYVGVWQLDACSGKWRWKAENEDDVAISSQGEDAHSSHAFIDVFISCWVH